ncbi:13008_t:CDS:2 [Cetraspora pellucida]|uniref:13008_t:CDS:1 n=1 Tax=Cetraspora pellucida TaxID=1433469 RepID=A0A9N9DM34_9GLOM|nr:13008_t:CDS:2 [Cetraspora pellucida]
MFRGARHSLLRGKNSLTRTFSKDAFEKGKLSFRRSISMKKDVLRDVTEILTLEEVHLIVKRCADEILERGLHEIDIFKPTKVGDNADEVRYLIKCMLREYRIQFEDEIKNRNIRDVASAMKWALRHSASPLVPYSNYEEFVRYEQEWDYDPQKGSFNQFLLYLPKQNQEILIDLFELCSRVTAESNINNMSAQKIVKSLALCILGESSRSLRNFDSAYLEWSKCSDACLHLFLAYLRELQFFSPDPRLSKLLNNYVEYRKTSNATIKAISQNNSDLKLYQQIKRMTTIIEEDDESVSMLRVTRQFATTKQKIETRTSMSFLPEVMDGLKRQTIVRPDETMSTDEMRTAKQMWEQFQNHGIGALSDDFLKLYFLLEKANALRNLKDPQVKFVRKGHKSFYLNLPPIITSNISGSHKQIEFTERKNNNDSIRRNLSRRNSRKKPHKNNLKGKKKSTKFQSSKRKRASLSSDSDQAKENDVENLEDWNLIDQSKDLPITTHLSIETIDEIFPYVWIETTAADQGDRWGEWVFIEPRKGLVHECEWVMIEEKSHAFSGSQSTKTPVSGKRRTLNIPWTTKGKEKSRLSNPINEIGSYPSSTSSSSFASSSSPSSPILSSSSSSPIIVSNRNMPDDNEDMFTVIYQFENTMNENIMKNTTKGKKIVPYNQGNTYDYFGKDYVESKDKLPIQTSKKGKNSVKKNPKSKDKIAKRQRIMQIGV